MAGLVTMVGGRLEEWRRSEVLGQLIRYALTGLAVTALYAAIYWPLATYVLNPNIAVAIAFVIATLVGRVAHGRVSFRGHGSRGEGTAWRFFIVSALGFVLNQLFTWVLVTGPFLGGPTWWPLLPALFVTPLATFVLSRLWVFR